MYAVKIVLLECPFCHDSMNCADPYNGHHVLVYCPTCLGCCSNCGLNGPIAKQDTNDQFYIRCGNCKYKYENEDEIKIPEE